MFRNWLTCVAVTIALVCPALTHADPTADQKAAAMETLKAMKVDEMLENSMSQMLDVTIKQAPQLARFKGIMSDFYKKYMSWDTLKDDLSRIYAEEFTIEELKGLKDFYESPLGKKLASKTPTLMAKMGELSQARVQEHTAELQSALQEEMKKNPNP